MKSEETSESHVKVMGVELAPIRIPFHRRLETLAVLQWELTFLLSLIIVIVTSIYLLFTKYYPLVILAYLWAYYDRKTPRRGGRRCEWIRHWRVWVHMRNFFPVHLIKTADLDPGKNHLLGFHPHGIMSMGAFVNFCTEANEFAKKFPGIKPFLLTLSGWFRFPLARDYIMMAGVCDVSRESLDWLLGQSGPGNAVVIVVGGVKEVLEAQPHRHVIYLSKRKGFVRKALKHGASLVPVYSFGETNVYEQIPNPEGSFLRKLQALLTKVVGIPPSLFHGRGIFNYNLGFLPYRQPIFTVVGKPIPLDKNPNPTQEEIDKVHAEYIASLVALFDEHKTKYGIEEEETLKVI
ncbi:2-acylglycerol O-acyltransferase 2-A-like [Acanthaster planci]|uniref:Acyltransferase n=1 Tax=Acanthaster planci TaxID=133434 RepID=A0A8B7Z124_ACAPL|nr:2-acylglycerol O-acyltransferase 2-A-like [Acanthaster planci]